MRCLIYCILGLGCLVSPFSVYRSFAADRFRTDINPALLYWQAWAQIPELSESDRGFLFTNDWRGKVLTTRIGDLLSRYDNLFKLVGRAGKAQVPCVWGYDMSDGPEVLLPGLAKAKSVAEVARLRVAWHLQQSNQAAARDEWLAAFKLGRNLATDRILISALVQISIETICLNTIVDNFPRFQKETLSELVAGIETSPPRGTIADCIPTERDSMYGWLRLKIADLTAESKSNEQALEKAKLLLQLIVSTPDQPKPEWGNQVLAAAGGSMEGLTRYLDQLMPLYQELDHILRLPSPDALDQIKGFNQRIEKHPNLIAREFLGVFQNSLSKEIAASVKIAMFKAAVAYTQRGKAGLETILDPTTKAPFMFEPFVFQQTLRGFQLRSDFSFGGFPGVLIFAEKDGPGFYAYGKEAGKPLK